MNKKNNIFNCINVMVDIETTSSENNAGILSIAMVPFQLESGLFVIAPEDDMPRELSPFVVYPSLIDQFFNGAHFDQDTQNWWKDKPQDVKSDIIMGQNGSLLRSMQSVASFIHSIRNKHIDSGACDKIVFWSQGIDFDRRILENAFNRVGIEIPWKYYDWMDCRTVTALFNIEHDRSKIVHSAYADCVNQINELVQATSQLPQIIKNNQK